MTFKTFDINAAIDAFEAQTQTAIGYLPEKAQAQAEVISETNFELARQGAAAFATYAEIAKEMAEDAAAKINETYKSFAKFPV